MCDRNKKMRSILAVCSTVCAALTVASPAQAQPSFDNRWRVDAAAPPGGDGQTWATALNNLQDALEETRLSVGTDEIWVAAGTYKPSVPYCPFCNPGQITDRHKTFLLLEDVSIYGGFLGNADPGGGETQLSQRDPETNITTLSGDLNGDDDPADFPNGPTFSENVSHVVRADNIGPSAILNGFMITAGNATRFWGGGILLRDAGPKVVRCTFRQNFATWWGGGLMVLGSFSGTPVVVNCSFIGNHAGSGGGIMVVDGSVTVVNSLFQGNKAEGPSLQVGGGIALSEMSTATVTNCTFSGNSAANAGGGLSVELGIPATASNCVFWGNTPDQIGDFDAFLDVAYSCVQDDVPGDGNVWPGTGNIDLDPLFCDEPNGNLRLQDPSPCIDAALDSFLPSDSGDVDDDGNTTEILPWDLDKRQRVFDLVNVDMGAYENQHDIDCPADFDGDGDVGPFDLAVLLGNWGPCPGCPADLYCDGEVDALDLAILLGSWGPCGGSSHEGPGGDYEDDEDDEELIEALEEMGFDDVDEFNAWTASVPTDEAQAATQQLLELLTE